MSTTGANLNHRKVHFILASASPRRKELIGLLQVPFSIKAADIDEEIAENDPRRFVTILAQQKGLHIFEQAKKDHSSLLVLSADTTVCIDKEILNKPKDRKDAELMLRKLSGKTHEVFTGVSMIFQYGNTYGEWSKTVRSEVTFSKIDETLLQHYLDGAEPYDKAGAYGIQGQGLMFVERVNGSYSNVVGLPLSDVIQGLETIQKKYRPDLVHWRSLF
jgi:septum formation protein